jgi:hypothetical protein
VLSIVGVLSAGTAAALVNTQVLETEGAAGDPAAVSTSAPPSASTVSVAPDSTLLVQPTVTTAGSPAVSAATSSVPIASVETAPSTSAAPASIAPPAIDPAAPSTGVYQLGDGGTVTLSSAGDVLTIVAVDPAPGWFVKDAEHEDAHNVEVRLRSDDREVRFEANLLFGVINTSLRTDDD